MSQLIKRYLYIAKYSKIETKQFDEKKAANEQGLC